MKSTSVETPLRKRKRVLVSQDERMRMLFWFTVFDGNINRTAKQVTKETGIKRNRKVVFETAKKYNFATLSHVVRDEVNKRFYGSDTPGMGRVMKLAADRLEIDEELILHCKRFLMGDHRSKVKEIKELLDAMKYITADLSNMANVKDLKGTAFSQIAKKTRPEIALSMDQILASLDEDEKANVLGKVVDDEIVTILENHGQDSNKREKRKDQIFKDLALNMDKSVT